MTTAGGILYITHVEEHGVFLKVWGQIDKNLPSIIEKTFKQISPQFDHNQFLPPLESIQLNALFFLKHKDGCYYRVRVINVAMLSKGLLEVHFVDYGYHDTVLIQTLRTCKGTPPDIFTVPPQAKEFILANVTRLGSSWDPNALTIIGNEIRFTDLQWIALSQIGTHTLIKLYKNGEDYALSLFNRGLVVSIASTAQYTLLQNTVRVPAAPLSPIIPQYRMVNSLPATPTTPPIVQNQTPVPTLVAFKANVIEPGTENQVYVSYVSDGPCQFSVQLYRLEATLVRLMKEINRMNLQPLEDDPLPGTVCVARCIEDDHICRAVVTSMVDGQYKVFYVDFGNTEIVPIDNLYQIPFKYVIPKVMAMRYSLYGLERSSVTVEMKCAFKEFVSDKLLKMRTLPSLTRSALPRCELWDDNEVNVLDVLQKAALLAYPEKIQLTRGFSSEVTVSYVHSCSYFYVQIKAKESELSKVMAELQTSSSEWLLLKLSELKVGTPCCALFDVDQLWYRAEILQIEGNRVKVRYVDYGNEEFVSVDSLRMPIGKLLTVLRPQAIECCLNGYQNMEDDLERDNILEELILNKEFTMKVIEMQGNRALVELIDSSRYNVGSLLLEKLATAHSQVSPPLIQDSHHIEQRKRRSPNPRENSQYFKSERKFSRNQNDMETDYQKQDSRDRKWSNKYNNDQNERKWGGNKQDQDENDESSFQRQDSRDRKWGGNRQDFGDQNDRSKQGFRDRKWGGDRNDRDSRDQKWGDNKQNSNDSEWGSRNENFKDRGRNNNQQDSADDGWNDNKSGSWRQKRNEDDSEKKDFNHNKSWRDRDNSKRPSFKKEGWGDGESMGRGNSRFSNDRDGSDKGWNEGSDKGFRSNSRQNNDRPPRSRSDFGSSGGGDDSWNSSSRRNQQKIKAKVNDPAPSSAAFTIQDLSGRQEKIVISWFHNPSYFYCQLQDMQTEFRSLMNEIQEMYCNIEPESVPVGAPAIALFSEDGVMYRANILEVTGMKYRVKYIDFGNIAVADKVWPIDNKFMILPAQAISCGINGLLPMEETWPDPALFSDYFNKEFFMCSFISNDENNKYLVELTLDGESVREGLVANSLAKYEESGVNLAYFDPNLLLAQQMHVTIGEVLTLDQFYVILQNGLQILCGISNLESATHKFEDVLKALSECTVIMYIDNVLEDRLEVTLYDMTGMKLKIIEIEEPGYETIEPLCAMPVFYTTFNAWLSFLKPAENEQCYVYLQLSEYSDNLEKLLTNLFEHYNETVQSTPITPEVQSFYAVQSSDENWYRGQVTTVEDEKATVTFVDYGNSEEVFNTQLRELTQEFKQQHILALELLVSGIDETYIEQEVQATVWYGENCWEAEIKKLSDILEPETVQLEEQVVADIQVQEEKPGEEVEQNTIEATTEVVVSQVGVPVIVSHIDSPNEFYLQLLESVDVIGNLQVTLQEQVEGYPDLENPVAGVLCAAPYSIDQQWYRAQVLDGDSDITTVRFVDYGNTDVLTNATTRVKTLPPDLLSLEQYARRCSLIVQPIDTEWNSSAYELFESLTSAGNLEAKIIHQEEKTTYIKLYTNKQDIAEVLLQEGLATKLQLEVESSCSGYVSHLNSPSEFWVQLENSVADLESIAEQLSVAEQFPELEDLTPGSLCAALFTDDEMWYRARILSNTVAGLEVLFIDYGNSCTCSGLRQLPEDLIMLPALAQKCSLQKPVGILQWSAQATEDFKNISADGATIFKIDKLSTGETTVVRLLLEDEDIAMKLLPKTEDAYVTHYETITDFWIQKAEDLPKLETITTNLAKAENWPRFEEEELSGLVAVLYNEDGLWYRAQILNKKETEFEVLLIDYGITSTSSDVRVLTECKEDCPLAIKVKLDVLPGYRWTDASSEKLSEIISKADGLFQVELISKDTVRLYSNGSDVRASLEGTYISSVQCTPKRLPPDMAEITSNMIDEDQLTYSKLEQINQSDENKIVQSDDDIAIDILNQILNDEKLILKDNENSMLSDQVVDETVIDASKTEEIINVSESDPLISNVLVPEDEMATSISGDSITSDEEKLISCARAEREHDINVFTSLSNIPDETKSIIIKTEEDTIHALESNKLILSSVAEKNIDINKEVEVPIESSKTEVEAINKNEKQLEPCAQRKIEQDINDSPLSDDIPNEEVITPEMEEKDDSVPTQIENSSYALSEKEHNVSDSILSDNLLNESEFITTKTEGTIDVITCSDKDVLISTQMINVEDETSTNTLNEEKLPVALQMYIVEDETSVTTSNESINEKEEKSISCVQVEKEYDIDFPSCDNKLGKTETITTIIKGTTALERSDEDVAESKEITKVVEDEAPDNTSNESIIEDVEQTQKERTDLPVSSNIPDEMDATTTEIKVHVSQSSDNIISNVVVETATVTSNKSTKATESELHPLSTETKPNSEQTEELNRLDGSELPENEITLLKSSSLKSLIEDSSSCSNTHTPERRSSTPHCEKIVPGAICRGDLTPIDNEQYEEPSSVKVVKGELDNNACSKVSSKNSNVNGVE